MRATSLVALVIAGLLSGVSARAAEDVQLPAPSARASAASRPPQTSGAGGGIRTGGFDAAAAARGEALLRPQCGFCHGPQGRGGNTGPDLIRSALVMEDPDGRNLFALLQTGRPDRGMPAFNLTADQARDIWTYLQSQIRTVAARGEYRTLNILVGDPGRGRALFEGPGGCAGCHSATGDLKGVGARYTPEDLQNHMLNPRYRPARGAPPPAAAPYLAKSALRATVEASGGAVTGALVRLTDFDVAIYEADSGRVRTWLRSAGTPKVRVVNPLQAHVDLLYRLKDDQIHDLTAYLAGLK